MRLVYILGIIAAVLLVYILSRTREEFALPSISDSVIEAIDTAPSTSEVKGHYKTLLIYANSDFRGSGIKSMRLLGDLRDRLFGPRNFRKSLKVEDILANWPAWLPPLATDTPEIVPSTEDAVTAELRVLSYIQKNFPEEPGVDSKMGSVVQNIIKDFAYRFVYESNETMVLKSDFLLVPLTKDWLNPTAGT
jgi:hypothetical protein